jgi:hypothetical protein
MIQKTTKTKLIVTQTELKRRTVITVSSESINKVFLKPIKSNTMKTKTFEIKAYCNKEKNFFICEFICEIIKHSALKKYANNSIYWFEGLDSKDWFRGGWYNINNGFINANVLIGSNVEGVVIEGTVYKLISVKKLK